MNADAMFSSEKEDWETPQVLFDELLVFNALG